MALGLWWALLPSGATGSSHERDEAATSGPRVLRRQPSQVSRGLLMTSMRDGISGCPKTACVLGHPYARVAASRWCFIAAGPSGDGSLVRGHTATVAWPGSVGRWVGALNQILRCAGQVRGSGGLSVLVAETKEYFP